MTNDEQVKKQNSQAARPRVVSDSPLLLSEWCYEKNLSLKPEYVKCGSGKKVWWKCEKGHLWVDSPSHRIAGRGCPFCSHHRLLPEDSLAEKYPSIAEEWDYDRNQKSPSDYAAVSGKRVFWKCKEKGHQWEAKISDRTKKETGCPYCSGKLAWPGETDLGTLFPTIAKQWHPTKNCGILLSTVRPGSNKKYWWICENGHEWEDSPNHRTSGRGCPFCSHKRLVKENSLAAKFPDIAEEWDYDQNQGKPSDYPAFSNKRVAWICKSCGERWYAYIASRTKLGSGCPVCRNQAIISGVNDLKTINPLLAEEWDYEKNDLSPTKVGAGSPQRVWWKCAFGHSWQASIKHRNSGTGCPECIKYRKTSLQEFTFFYYVNSNFSDAVHSYSPPDFKRKEIDIYIPSENVGIEYDGEFWHRSVEKDKEKDKLCISLGIKLIRIREPNCIDYKRDAPTIRLIDTSKNSLQMAIEQVLGYLGVRPISINIEEDHQKIIASYRNTAIASSFAVVYPDLASQWHPTKNGTLLPENVPSKASALKIYWLCPICNSSWQASIDARIRGSGCPVCAGRVVKVGYNDLATKHPEIASQWHPSRNSTKTPSGIPSHSHIKVWWICEKGHEWESTVKDRVAGNGCPVCAGKKVLEGDNDLATVNPLLAEEWDSVLNVKRPTEVAPHSGYKAFWRCRTCGHVWQAAVYNRAKGSGCPQCAQRKRKK